MGHLYQMQSLPGPERIIIRETRKLRRYEFKRQEGKWIPTPPAYMAAVEPYWNKIRPLLLDSASQFKPAAPDPFNKNNGSSFYKLANEVYEAGKQLNERAKEYCQLLGLQSFFPEYGWSSEFRHKKDIARRTLDLDHWHSLPAIQREHDENICRLYIFIHSHVRCVYQLLG